MTDQDTVENIAEAQGTAEETVVQQPNSLSQLKTTQVQIWEKTRQLVELQDEIKQLEEQENDLIHGLANEAWKQNNMYLYVVRGKKCEEFFLTLNQARDYITKYGPKHSEIFQILNFNNYGKKNGKKLLRKMYYYGVV